MKKKEFPLPFLPPFGSTQRNVKPARPCDLIYPVVRNPKYQQEVLDKVIALIGDPKNIDFEMVKNELKKLSLQ